MVRVLYSFFIGLLIATFVGVGIQAFYHPPLQPAPRVLPVAPESNPSAKLQDAAQQQEWIIYQDQMKIYSRNVSVISLVAAVIILTLSLSLLKKIEMMGDGMLLGSVFTLIYSFFRGFESQDDIFRFIVVSAGLVISVFIGFQKFVRKE